MVDSEEQARAVQENYITANLPVREKILLDYAVRLTKSPSATNKDDLDFLRRHGYSDEQLVDAVQCISYFNFINRVLDGLGVDPEAGMRYAHANVQVSHSTAPNVGGY